MSTTVIFALFAGAFLAFSNGANDNFKGVATLFGSKTTTYKIALLWATLTTLAGSLFAIYMAQKLIINFSGKGLVPDDVVQLVTFSSAVAISSAITVFMATRFGFPISTTHAITGALVGAGLFASPDGIVFDKLLAGFLLPLIISPLIAIIGMLTIHPILKYIWTELGVTREACVCVGNMNDSSTTNHSSAAINTHIHLMTGNQETCKSEYVNLIFGLEAKQVLDTTHFLSSGLVSFARGLNDTPKIAAILLVGNSLTASNSIVIVSIMILFGGLIMSKKVAKTMSLQITHMNESEGLIANLITSTVVIGASILGLPVSTTHVSCGSLFGVGIISKQANWRSIQKIILAWIITLPIACILGVLFYFILNRVSY